MSTTNTRPSSSVSNTITLREPGSSQQTLVLRLNPRKKKVTWKEGTVDNEFMGKKSSKKCCIFHKEKPFDEDNSDEEDHDHHHHHHDHKCKDAGEPSTSNWLIHQDPCKCTRSHWICLCKIRGKLLNLGIWYSLSKCLTFDKICVISFYWYEIIQN